MCSGLVSAISSSTIIVMVLISKRKFGDPYRRMICGISLFDIFASFALVFKMFKTTPEQPNSWIALGNQTSCDVLGFMHYAGVNGALFYNVSLNIYYVCLVKYNLTAHYYVTRVEPYLHVVPIAWAFITSSILVGKKYMNPAYAGDCLIAPYPVNCLEDPDVDCIHGEKAHLYRIVFYVGPILVSLFFVLFAHFVLWKFVRAIEKQMDHYRLKNNYRSKILANGESVIRGRVSGKQTEGQNQRFFNRHGSLGSSNCFSIKNKTSGAAQKKRPTANKGRYFLIQARWYCLAFAVTYFPSILITFLEWFDQKGHVSIYVIARLFNPLQGFFNVIIYTHPHVIKERKKNPALSWFQAFRTVVASGGDDDNPKRKTLRKGKKQAKKRAKEKKAGTHFLNRKQANESTEDAKEAAETKYTEEKDVPTLKDVFTGDCPSPQDTEEGDGSKSTEEKDSPTLKDVFTGGCPSSVHGSFTSSLRGTLANKENNQEEEKDEIASSAIEEWRYSPVQQYSEAFPDCTSV